MPLLFLKAKKPGLDAVVDDLFGLVDKPILHQGHATKTGAYVAPFVERHKVRPEPPAAEPPTLAADPRGLDLPETYEASPELAALARRLAKENYDLLGRPRGIGLGDLKREFTAGKHASVVAAAMDGKAAAEEKAEAKSIKGRAEAEALVAPPGYVVTIEGETLRLKGPFDDDLHARIKRAGGTWDGITHGNTKSWLIPVEKGSTLKRIFANWTPPPPESPEAAAREAEKATRDKLETWVGYVEAAARDGRLYQKGMDTLRELGINKHPDLQARVEAATTKVMADRAKEEAGKAATKKARAEEEANLGKTYLNVPYEDKDKAKRHGARWDPERRSWYVLGSSIPDALADYSMEPKELPFGYHRFQVGSGYGGKPFEVGQVVRFDGAKGLEFLTVIKASKSYYKEDGLSFGVGDDEGWIYSAVARPSTPEESAPIIAEDARKKAKLQANTTRHALAKIAREQGELPPGPVVPEGEEILDTATPYGGGDWWVIGKDAIWYVQNNGGDGDDWSRNNVRTGGAGAIGWKLPYNAEMEASLRQAADILAKSLQGAYLFLSRRIDSPRGWVSA